MEKVSKNHHLLSRKGVWYYSRRTPDPLVAEHGPLIGYSLKTKNKTEAVRLRELEDLKWSARLAEKEGKPLELMSGEFTQKVEPGPKRSDVELVRDYVARMDRGAEGRLVDDPPYTAAQRQEMQANVATALGILRTPEDPRAADWVQDVARRLRGGAPPEGDDAVLDEYVRRALLELQSRQLARLQDDRSRSFFDPLFDPSRPSETTFGELADQYVALKAEEASVNQTSQKTLDKQRANAALLRTIVGDDRPMAALTFDAALQVRSTLSKVPANWTKLFKGLSLEEAIAQAAAQGKPTLSPLTQQQYLATFKDLLDLAVKKRLIPNNPADGIRPLKRDDVALQDKRQP